MVTPHSPLSTWQRWLLGSLTGLVALLILFFALLPFGIQYGIGEGLRSMGAAEARVVDVDFNPFKGVLVIRGLEVKGTEGPPLSLAEVRLDVSLSALWRHHVQVESLYLHGLRASLVHETDAQGNPVFGIAGMRFPGGAPAADTPEEAKAAEAAAEPWGFGIDSLRLSDIQAQYMDQGAELSATLSTLEAFTFYTWSPQTLSRIHLAGTVNGAPLRLSLEAAPLASPIGANAQLQLTDFDLATVKAYFPSGIEGVQGHLALDWRMNLELAQTQDLELSLTGDTGIQGLAVSLPEQQVSLVTEALSVSGETLVQRKTGQTIVSLLGGLQHQGLQLTQGQLLAGYEQFQWDGEMRVVVGEGPVQYFLGGNVMNAGLALSLLEGEKKMPLLNVKTVQVSDIHAEDKAVNIGAIRLDACQVQVRRLPDGALYLPATTTKAEAPQPGVPEAAKTGETAPKAPAPEAAASEPAQSATLIRIGEIAIEGDSRVAFLDESVSPHFRLNVAPLRVQVRDIDSAQKAKASAVSLNAKLNEYADVDIQGEVFAFADKPTLKLSGKVRSLELPPLSSYTEPQLGYNLSSGHLNADISLKIDQGTIDSENQLRIKQLKLEPSNPDKMEKFSKKLSMPLDAALSLLRDKDDNIKLKLPVKGDLESPDFDIADAINQSLGTAMKFAAMHYIKLALQPYGTLISLYQAAGTAGKMMTSIRMDPVNYAPNAAVLDEAATSYLQTSLKLLTERPKLNIKICGKAGREDYAAMVQAQALKSGKKAAPLVKEVAQLPPEINEQLLKLARERGDAVKRYLVEQGGIDAGRLFVCHPEVDFAEESKPRAELLI